ncbi:MAG: hypothetical protein KBS41_02370 [Oscillospiraceae bacterium]|nr:hypothetical protein [Candidatus Equicaccousia limihippi]
MPKRKNIKQCLQTLLNGTAESDDRKTSGSMEIAKGLFTAAKEGSVPAIKVLLEITESEENGDSAALSRLYKALDQKEEP